MNKTKRVDLHDILIGSQGNQIVVRMDFPGAVYVEPLREFCAKNRMVWIGGQPWPLSKAISWEFSFWVDDGGIPRDEWIRRLDRIANQTSLERCDQILKRGY